MNRLPPENCNTLRQGAGAVYEMQISGEGGTQAVIAPTSSVKSTTTEVMWLLMRNRWGLGDFH